jgi:hypothetical protein
MFVEHLTFEIGVSYKTLLWALAHSAFEWLIEWLSEWAILPLFKDSFSTALLMRRWVIGLIFVIGIVEVQLGPLGTAAANRPIVPAPDDYDNGEIGGIIVRGNRSTLRKPAPVPLCPPQTTHAVRTRHRTAAVGSQRLTSWATARPEW